MMRLIQDRMGPFGSSCSGMSGARRVGRPAGEGRSAGVRGGGASIGISRTATSPPAAARRTRTWPASSCRCSGSGATSSTRTVRVGPMRWAVPARPTIRSRSSRSRSRSPAGFFPGAPTTTGGNFSGSLHARQVNPDIHAETRVDTTMPAGQTVEADLAASLDGLSAHPNIAPFILTRRIQVRVKSNPTPAYIARLAAVFGNNGVGVRGDLKAGPRDPARRRSARRGGDRQRGAAQGRSPQGGGVGARRGRLGCADEPTGLAIHPQEPDAAHVEFGLRVLFAALPRVALLGDRAGVSNLWSE